jgi:hypothetical protein
MSEQNATKANTQSGDELLTIMADEFLPRAAAPRSATPSPESAWRDDESLVIDLPEHRIRNRVPNLLTISLDDILQPTLIEEPLDQGDVGQQLHVAGRAHPRSRLAISAGTFYAEVNVGADGRYALGPITIERGVSELTLYVQSLTYPRGRRVVALARVHVRQRPLLYVGHKDMLTQARMKTDDEVVRCRRGGHFSLLGSWLFLGGCVYPQCGERRHWTPNDDQFYAPRD